MSTGKGRLDPLPASDDKYFTKYKADIHKVEDKKPPKCEHYFFYYRSGQVECRNCHTGFYLDIGDLLKDGHIYRKNKLII